jgi:hypothetical protein
MLGAARTEANVAMGRIYRLGVPLHMLEACDAAGIKAGCLMADEC